MSQFYPTCQKYFSTLFFLIPLEGYINKTVEKPRSRNSSFSGDDNRNNKPRERKSFRTREREREASITPLTSQTDTFPLSISNVHEYCYLKSNPLPQKKKERKKLHSRVYL
ncbi:hypothetical protein CDAR_538871 [Caerostris darwini]|uniref:Uncharacterized protein n=1 Tax=Caerostris darwini TaxID=1538125 RepID=A0AAV4T6H0_9ARAC|nr:hypothetical protein CDAR_538871 [Caerostris darwini]